LTTASWTQADLDAVNRAISTGAKRVRFQTHEVEYQSVDDLMRVRSAILSDLGQESGGLIFVEYSGGY
jgi:hypothetical protein